MAMSTFGKRMIAMGLAIGFIGAGFVFPRYLLHTTEITPTSVRLVRGDGFMSTVAYERDVAADTETLTSATAVVRSVSIVYSGACKCIERFTHYSGATVYTVFVFPERREMFYVKGHETTLDGIPQKTGTTIPISKAQAELAEAQSFLDSMRRRFAAELPRS